MRLESTASRRTKLRMRRRGFGNALMMPLSWPRGAVGGRERPDQRTVETEIRRKVAWNARFEPRRVVHEPNPAFRTEVFSVQGFAL